MAAPGRGRAAVEGRGELGHGIVVRRPRLLVLGWGVTREAVLRRASGVHQGVESDTETRLDQVNGSEHVRPHHRAEVGLGRIRTVGREVKDPLGADTVNDASDRGAEGLAEPSQSGAWTRDDVLEAHDVDSAWIALAKQERVVLVQSPAQ